MGFPISVKSEITIGSTTDAAGEDQLEAGASLSQPIQTELAFVSTLPVTARPPVLPLPSSTAKSPVPSSPPSTGTASGPSKRAPSLDGAPAADGASAATTSQRILGLESDPSRGPAVARWIAVVGGCGYVPVAPGTAGSAAGALFFVPLFGLATSAWWMPSMLPGIGLGPQGFAVLMGCAIVAVTLVGIWAAGWAEHDFCLDGGSKDDGRIVIDEVAGQMIALAPLSLILTRESNFFSIGVGVVTGFVLFRLFDVWKPGAIRWAEHKFDGGLGVMADDLVAGVYAASVLVALYLFVSAEGFHLDERLSAAGILLLRLGRPAFVSADVVSADVMRAEA